jgi:hypothetical protein
MRYLYVGIMMFREAIQFTRGNQLNKIHSVLVTVKLGFHLKRSQRDKSGPWQYEEVIST